jgi:hypothetical protein
VYAGDKEPIFNGELVVLYQERRGDPSRCVLLCGDTRASMVASRCRWTQRTARPCEAFPRSGTMPTQHGAGTRMRAWPRTTAASTSSTTTGTSTPTCSQALMPPSATASLSPSVATPTSPSARSTPSSATTRMATRTCRERQGLHRARPHDREHDGVVEAPGGGAALRLGPPRLLPLHIRGVPGHALRALSSVSSTAIVAPR